MAEDKDGGKPLLSVTAPYSADSIMRFFKYDHLPEHLQKISKPFGDMASWVQNTIPRNAERTVALRKLLEAKDAAVRANLPDSE